MKRPYPEDYTNQALYIDGAVGTAQGRGTADDPVATLAQALALAVELGYRIIRTRLRAETLADDLENYVVIGDGLFDVTNAWDLNAQRVEGSWLEGLLITGEQGGASAYFRNCIFRNGEELFGKFDSCTFILLNHIADDSDSIIRDCIFTGSLDMDDPGTLLLANASGTVQLTNLGGGTVNVYSMGGLDLTLAASCIGGTVNVYGNVRLTDNSAGTTVNDYSVRGRIQALQGGTETLESLHDELKEILDLARSAQSGATVMTGAVQTLYEESGTVPFEFRGGWIDFTGCNFGGGENTTVNLDVKYTSGGGYITVGTATFLGVALPVPVMRRIPNAVDFVAMDIQLPIPNIYGVRVTAQQAAVGGGWNTLNCEWYDAKRGS